MISVKGNTTSDDDDFIFLLCLILDCGYDL